MKKGNASAFLFSYTGNCVKNRAAGNKWLDLVKLFGSGSGHNRFAAEKGVRITCIFAARLIYAAFMSIMEQNMNKAVPS